MKRIMILLTFITMSIFSVAQEKVPDYARINFMSYAFHNQNIVDICVYKLDWTPPSKSFPKGHSQYHAVVISVHKGQLKVGDKLTYNRYIELDKETGSWKEFSRKHPKSSKIVEGKLETIIFCKDDYKINKKAYDLLGDAGHKFGYDSDFYKALIERKKIDPMLKGSLEDE